jgi:hypothetical protein
MESLEPLEGFFWLKDTRTSQILTRIGIKIARNTTHIFSSFLVSK